MITIKAFKLNYFLITSTIILLLFSMIFVVYATDHQEEETFLVPIIMYHSVLKSQSGKYIVHPDVLESDMQYIEQNGFTTITINDLISYVYHQTPLPEKPIILTFDDGHYNNLGYVLPLLETYHMVAVISIVGEYTDTYTQSDEANMNYSYLRWKDITEMMHSGRVEFQNHSYSLHEMTKHRIDCMKRKSESVKDYETLLTNDLLKLQEEFQHHTGYLPTAFTYPFGAVSNASLDIIKNLGFRASLSCEEGVNLITKDPDCLYQLKRFNRANNSSTESFFQKITSESNSSI